MAQADWEFTTQGAGTTLGGAQGEARLHSALSSPLSGEGDYCREYLLVGGGSVTHWALIDPAVNGGEFAPITNAFSWSVRCWFRQAGTAWSSGSIGIKLGGFSTYDDGSGYRLAMGHYKVNQPGEMYLVTHDENGVNGVDYLLANDEWPAGLWKKGRLDCIPDAGNQDLLQGYVGTGATGSEIWTQRGGDIVVTSAMPNYCVWGDANANRIGYSFTSNNQANSTYFDRFQVFKEAVP